MEILDIYEIVWKNMVDSGRQQMTIYDGEENLQFARRKIKARIQTHTDV
jgi:hypothetical protein